jgi:hypothetical protein
LSIVALIVLLPSCKSYNDDVNPLNAGMTRVSVRMLATSSMAGFGAAGRTSTTSRLTSGDSVTFESMLLGVSKLKFDLKDTTQDDSTRCGDDDGRTTDPGRILHGGDGDEDEDEDDSTKLNFEGAFVVDLLNGTSTPDFGIAQVVPGVFSEIEIKLAPILPDSNSIFVKGTVFIDSIPYHIEFSSHMRMSFKIHSKEGIELNGSLNSILVELDLDRFFENINLASAQVDDDGVIRINPSFNPGIFAFLHLKLPGALRCGKDDDHDGDIDD